ncbi:ubiquinone biosynthesis protein COQ4, mitochondrial [Fimicolochytrium jonesii]|uniref:ubiquinone biosynthesis protein COQ4, mitochondrial n=1 Tax=Fimicolochytrium jonesii TaxID=1396493 RepID=UPI0022FF2B23|nr:ubiquinone biosynthesis protein COQ4, mitochondrial [Fimicolochytrium jonesii]KAI8817459.1 ubiquinone biosynthesis protein COQ4, mitochondrial [Fimicolochytrium jonesii]
MSISQSLRSAGTRRCTARAILRRFPPPSQPTLPIRTHTTRTTTADFGNDPSFHPRPRTPNVLERAFIAATSAIGAMRDPTRQETVAHLGEVTGLHTLAQMRDKMLLSPTGRRILRTRPILTSTTLNLPALRRLPPGTFGREYVTFLDAEHVSPDTRVPVTYISDPELAYVMRRYREVHDFMHTLTGLPTTVEAEIALKWLEMVQSGGMPVAALSAFVGPLRLSAAERDRFFGVYVPWAVQCGASAAFVLNVYYEEMLEKPLETVRRELGFIPLPSIV